MRITKHGGRKNDISLIKPSFAMYFRYQQNHYCVNCDWLQYSVHLQDLEPDIICPDGYRIELCQGNNIFQHRALVFDSRGAKYLTLLWHPYSKVLPANLMTVQVANEYLYLDGGAGILWSYQDLQKIVDCTFNAIGRVDICCDFEGSEQSTQFVNHLNSGHYYCQHKSEGSTWWHDVGGKDTASKKQLHCLTWGSQKSDIKVKLYHKSREQGLINSDDAEKPWIVQQWQLNEMDIHNIWRLEFSMTGAGQLRWKGQPITLNNIADEQWLLDVFCELYHSRFVTRINQGRRNGHHNNDDRVYIFAMAKRATGLKWADQKGQDYELPAAITLLRAMMRQIDNPAIMSARPTFNDYATTILNLIDYHHLHGYFVRTYERDPSDYFDDLWSNVGQGIRHTTPSPARLMD